MYISNISLHLVWFGWLVLCIELECWITHHWQSLFYTDTTQGRKRERKIQEKNEHCTCLFVRIWETRVHLKIKRELRGQDQKHRHLVDFIIIMYILYLIFLKLFGEESLFRLRVSCTISVFTRTDGEK